MTEHYLLSKSSIIDEKTDVLLRSRTKNDREAQCHSDINLKVNLDPFERSTSEIDVKKVTCKIQGIVLKRRSLGKNLAFATLLLTDEIRNECSTILSNNIIQVKFHRQSPVWDKSQDASFPTKTFALPYNATIECEAVPTETTSTAGLENFLVRSWNVLENPRDNANEVAKLKNGKEDGLNCSSFLQKRAEAFSTSQNLLIPFQQTSNTPATSHRGKETKKANKQKHSKPVIHSEGQSKNHVGENFLQKHKTPITEVNNGSLILCQPIELKEISTSSLTHGDKRHKALRAKIFAQWILETYKNSLCKYEEGGVVLDVAGGKGNLSVELAILAKLSCIVMDPMVRKKFVNKKDSKRLAKAGVPKPKQVANFFYKKDFSVASCNSKVREMVQFSSCSLLVGLHPDECTEDIVDVALLNNLPMAIIPCCVYPSLSPNRHLRGSKDFVRSYDDFIKYLLEKDERLQSTNLPFEGKNQVIYLKT